MTDRFRSSKETESQESPTPRASDPMSRRRLLQRSVAVVAVAAPAGVLVAHNLRQAAAVSRAPAIEASVRSSLDAQAPQARLSPQAVGAAFQEIQQHENDHVTFIKGALGANARPKPSFKGLEQSSLSAFENVSRVLENTGVGAYLLGASAIQSKDILLKAASILTVESRHAGWINVLLNTPISPSGSFDKPLTQTEVATRASAFIASLNGGPDPSAALKSDTDILNFALLLEYLEAEFYNLNVPKFFGGSTPGNG